MLMEKGYSSVSVLRGGLLAWEEAGFPVDRCRASPVYD
jgi:rhodanese-related sulfurtransferase